MQAERRSAVPYGPLRKPWRDTLSTVAVSSADDGKLLVSVPSADPLEHENRGATLSTVAVSSADDGKLLVSVPSADPLEHACARGHHASAVPGPVIRTDS